MKENSSLDNKKIISLVSMLCFLIVIIGASFAYFGSFNKNISKGKVNITIDVGANATFVTSGVDLNIVIPPSKMVQYEVGTKAIENNTTLDVTLTSGNAKIKTTCTFDIYYEYNQNSSIYGDTSTPVTDASSKELTLKMGGNGTSDYSLEKNFNIDSNWINNSKRLVVKNATISDATTTGTTKSWDISMAFYNLDKDQNKLAGKTFSGTFYVEKDSINCDNESISNPTLYKTIENRYNKGDAFVKLYNGADYGDTTNYANNIYYFTGNVENNNVLFANYCWKIVRTTDTGGVKIGYNGIQKYVSDDYTLLNQSEYTNLSNDASYPYTFDKTNKTWTSTNTGTNSSTISFTSPSNGDYVINYDLSMYNNINKINVEIFKDDVSQGKFTGTTTGQIVFKDLTTSNVIKIVYTRKYSSTSGDRNNVIFSFGRANSIIKSCNNTGTDSQIGEIEFNEKYNSPAYVGYMYNENKVYTSSNKIIINSESFSGQKAYGDGATYASNKYTLTNAAALTVSSSNISTLVGKYTCNSSSTTGTCYNLWYIAGYSGTTIYYYSLSGGITDVTTLANQDYVFGSSFTYTNGSYSLTDTITINSDTFIANKSNVNTHHYTCLTNGNRCTSVYYVYYINDGTPYYITLTGGKSVNDALNEMLYADDVNTKDSTIKAYIDSWYETNIKDKYDNRLEDTVFCNDRSISSLNDWNPNGGSTSKYLFFKNHNTNYSLACENKNDRFTVSTSKGNGKLTYPVGLLTLPELSLAGYSNPNGHYFNSGQEVWLGSPSSFDGNVAVVREVHSGGWLYYFVGITGGVRPSVSIKPGTTISSGNGSYTSPFVIE